MKRGSCIRNLKTPQKPFCRKGEGEAGLVVANFLVSGTLFLRSGHGQEVPPEVNLHPKNVIPCSDKKRARHSFPPLTSRSWLRGGGFQLAVPSGSGSQTLLSCYCEGSRCPGRNWPPGGLSGGGRSPRWHDGILWRLLLPLGHRRRGG